MYKIMIDNEHYDVRNDYYIAFMPLFLTDNQSYILFFIGDVVSDISDIQDSYLLIRSPQIGSILNVSDDVNEKDIIDFIKTCKFSIVTINLDGNKFTVVKDVDTNMFINNDECFSLLIEILSTVIYGGQIDS